MKVIPAANPEPWWRQPGTMSTRHMAEDVDKLLSGWSAGEPVTRFAGNEGEIGWLAWHAAPYKFDRVYSAAHNIDILQLTPALKGSSNVWVSNDPREFIVSMRHAVGDLLLEKFTSTGQRYFMRPGIPVGVRLFGVSLYAERVTYGGHIA